ncbi:MAG: hypothetical protein ABUS48_06145 [Pseudomonadota bacterium]
MVAATLNPVRQRTAYFYVGLAAACVLMAFGGFAPTYWLQLPAGTFVGPPLLHVHGVLFSTWTLFLLSQAILAANGRMEHHRAWGVVGVSLATAMVFIGLTVATEGLARDLDQYGDRARAHYILPVASIALFSAYFIVAIANVSRPDIHKRLIFLATFALLQAAMARVFFVLATGGGPGMRPGLGPPPPVTLAIVPSLIVELLIVAGIIYDWRTRGRPHPVWLWGALVTTAVVLLRGPISETGAWRAFADAMAHIAG